MSKVLDLRCDPLDAGGLQREVLRRDKIIHALMRQVEHNLSAVDTDYALLQNTFVLEEQVRARTDELSRTLDELETARSETEAASKRLATAVESIFEGFALFDPADRLLMCNDAFKRLWGLDSEVIGQHVETLLSKAAASQGEDAAAWLQRRREAHQSGTGSDEYALPTGQYIQVRERRTSDGYTVGIYTDVTNLKAEEARLRQQQLASKSRLLQATLDAIVQGIAVFDRNLELAAWNRNFLILHDLPECLACEKTPLTDFLTLDSGLVSATPDVASLATEVIERFERDLASGRVVELCRSPMQDGGFVITATDVTGRRHIERQVRDLLDHQQVIFNNAHVGIVFLRQRRIVSCNQHMADIFGFDKAASLVDQTTEILYPSKDFFEIDGPVCYGELAERGVSDREILLRRDGSPVWIHRTGRPVDPRAPNDGSIWVFSDISEMKSSQEQLRLSKLLFENSNEGLMVTDANNRIVSVNRAYTEITGYTSEDAVGRLPNITKSDAHPPEFYQAMWQQLDDSGHWAGEIFARRKDGQIFPKWLTISVVKDGSGAVTNYVASFSDITDRKSAEAKIRFMAHHDSLTGLPNRVLLRDRFDQLHLRIQREGGFLGLCFLDLDHFKRINDTYGHRCGDQLIIRTARRISDCLRQSDTVARLGGDEFIILIEGQNSPAHFASVAQKIQRSLEELMDIDGQICSTSASIGIAVFPNDGTDFDTLLQKADTAMYHAKSSGRGTYSFFDARMNSDTASRLDIAQRLRSALSKKEMRLVYQPQFALPERRIVGVEALLRWRSEPHGDEAPDRFIPIAEETGQILQIGEWVLYEALSQARQWRDRGMPLRMAVNVSAVQIYRGDFSRLLEKALRDTGADPASIEIELTESTVMADTESIRDIFDQIRQLGVSVAIDDFGTGYSSLAYLRRFHVNKLKVDRSFVRDIPHDEESCAIAEAIIHMAHSLRLGVIAEGVETLEQLEFLGRIGCDEIQGYLLSRPVPPAEVEVQISAATGPGSSPGSVRDSAGN
jgi:diguanylate cyclase (GGDEF)-like protein/PAS domain S-box-containing protein